MKSKDNEDKKKIRNAILKEHNVKKKHLVALLGVSSAFISLIVSGKRNLPLEKAEILLQNNIPLPVVRELVNPKYKKIVEKISER